jgi:hypothetical protein
MAQGGDNSASVHVSNPLDAVTTGSIGGWNAGRRTIPEEARGEGSAASTGFLECLLDERSNEEMTATPKVHVRIRVLLFIFQRVDLRMGFFTVFFLSNC